MDAASRSHLSEEQDLAPKVIAWESTRACNFSCVHCRAKAQRLPDPKQLTTQEALVLMNQIAEFCKPILIISGGDPLLRKDVFEIASHASSLGIKVVMSPSGSDITPEVTNKIKASGIKMISISLDGSRPEIHDSFRQVPGAFNMALKSLRNARRDELPFKINTTVTQHNLRDLSNILKLAAKLGATAWDVFMLVPTGRGKVEMEITPEQYEETLHLIYTSNLASPIPIKMTCSPHYNRVVVQRERESKNEHSHAMESKQGPPSSVENSHPPSHASSQMRGRGCMAGNGFCFISHVGDVFGCGFLPVPAGNVLQRDFKQIYQESPLFIELRNYNLLRGKCGMCEYKTICGGCRARAFSYTGSYLEEEPYCVYAPIRSDSCHSVES